MIELKSGVRIIVKPVPRESVQRRHLTPVKIFDSVKKQFVDTGHVSGKTKARGATDILRFVPEREKGRFRTGLEQFVDNEFKGADWMEVKGRFNLSDQWTPLLPEIVDKDKISRQQWFEILDGVDPGYYSSVMHQDLRSTSTVFSNDPKRARTAIETFEVILHDGANTFHTDTSRGRLAIQLLKNHPEVALSREVVNSSYHNWYIAEENEEELDRVKLDNLENEAIAELTMIKKNNPEHKLEQIAVILGLIRGQVSPMVILDQLNRYIKTKGPDKVDNIENFLRIASILKDNPRRFETMYLIRQAVNLKILYTDGGYMFWKSQRDRAELFRWKSEEAFLYFIEEQQQSYDPKSPTSENAFATFLDELKQFGIIIK